MKLIGINGRLHSGKDTAVSFIRYAASPARVERAGFADKLKFSLARALDAPITTVDEAVAWCNRFKDGSLSTFVNDADGYMRVKVVSGRRVQQLYGTESHRDVFGTDFWVDALLPRPEPSIRKMRGVDTDNYLTQRLLEEAFPNVDVLVITDTRFPNEAERILDLGGTVWKIDADERLGPLPADAHSSEHGLPSEYVTLTVPNNGTLEQFDVRLQAAWRITNA